MFNPLNIMLQLFYLLGITNILLTVASAEDVEVVFKSYNIVPDVLKKSPKTLAKVSYTSGVAADVGNQLTPTQVQNQPKVEWPFEPNALYTLILTDPDAPSRTEPKFREFKHWAVVNILGNDIAQGDVLSAYIGSGPPKNTGLHRYVFLIYKQPNGKLDISKEPRVNNTSRRDRPKFSTAKFAEKYDLGDPIAGNFYQAEYDDYVPILHKQLSEN